MISSMRMALVLVVPFFMLGSQSCDSTKKAADGGARGQDAAVASVDAASGLATTCSGECKTMSLVATFGATTRAFDRAFFGLSSPSKSDSGEWEIYIENGAGDDDQCPSQTSPLPRSLLILSGLPLPGESPGPVSAVSANLVDFEGALLPSSPREKADSNSVRWTAYDLCLACAMGSEADRPSRMVALDIEASFAGGRISGHSYATHCDSLDQL